jgi:hypothetical protein
MLREYDLIVRGPVTGSWRVKVGAFTMMHLVKLRRLPPINHSSS